MDNKKILKQMVDLQKTCFKNCFSTMILLQDQAEKLIKTLVNHAPGITDENKKLIEQWTDTYKKGFEDLKKAVDEGYGKVEDFFNSTAMLIMQDQTEKMFDTFFNQKNWFPQDLKKAMEQLTDTYTKGCDDFKKYLDENVKRMEDFYSSVNKTQAKDKK